MATIYPSAGDDLQTVARRLIEVAGDPRLVTYRPGEGPLGSFDVPDDVADGYDPADAQAMGARVAEHGQALRDAHESVRLTPGPDDPTLEDTRQIKTNTVRGNVGIEGEGPFGAGGPQSHIGATEAAVLNMEADKTALTTQGNVGDDEEPKRRGGRRPADKE